MTQNKTGDDKLCITAERVRDDKVYVWEKRLTMILMTALLGYLTAVAVDVKTEITSLGVELRGVLTTLQRHENKIADHTESIHSNDNRIIKLETEMEVRNSQKLSMNKTGGEGHIP